MPRLTNRLPNYRKHRASGQAAVTLQASSGRETPMFNKNSADIDEAKDSSSNEAGRATRVYAGDVSR
jgi:hypothetical protein